MSKSRRKNGEGSIFKVAENKWVAKISFGTGPDGKPNIKQFSGKTQAIVKEKLKEFKKSKDYAKKHMPSNDTLQTYITAWLREYQYNKLKPASYDRLESTINKHIIPHLGKLKVDKVTRDNIQMLLNNLYKQNGLSYSSVKKVYVALNSCYKHALLDDVVIKNPCIGIILPSPKERTKNVTTLTFSEIERFKKESIKEKYYYGYAYLLILNTGLRMGEALSLKWSNIDFINKTITVNKNNVMVKKRDLNGKETGGYELQTQSSAKTYSGNRIIPINNSAENALMMLKKHNNTDYVIINDRQHQVLPSNFERSFHRVLHNANIEKCGVHILRHTFASMLFSKGVDVKIVSKLLGHSTVKITYDTYVHLFEKDILDITTVLD